MASSKKQTSGPNFEQEFKSEERFSDMNKLHQRFTDVKARLNKKMTEWENYLKCYRRWPIRRKDGGVDTNWGQFKFKIDKSIESFSDLIIERPTWAWIVPNLYEIDGTPITQKQRDQWARIISESWHRWFIQTWCDRIDAANDDCFDMQMFMAGIEYWCNKGDIYPENIPIEHCLPDVTAGRNPEKWETLFIIRRVSYIYLSEQAVKDGWNSEVIDDLLKNAGNTTSDLTEFEKLRLDVTDGAASDNSILVVEAYVKEYNGKITKYVMPESGRYIPSKNPNEPAETRYLYKETGYCDHIGQVVAIRTFHRFKRYWSGESLADNIYPQCLNGDRTTNRLVRAGLRQSTVFIATDTPDLAERLRGDVESEVQVIDSGAQIKSTGINTATADLLNTTRALQFDTDRYNSDSLESGFQNSKGRAITASENQSNLMRSSQAVEAKMNLFINQDARLVKEIYRRSLKPVGRESGSEKLKSFKEELKSLGVPEEAYKFENVIITSVFSLMGGNFIAQQYAVDKLLAFARIKPESDEVREVQKDAIATIVGYDRVNLYLPYKEQIETAESQHAGTENEMLDNPELNPANVQVLPNDNHMVHINSHFFDVEGDLARLNELINVFPQTPEPLKALALDKMASKTKALENKMGHIKAHLTMLALDTTQQDIASAVNKKIVQTEAIQTSLTKAVDSLFNTFLQEAQSNTFMTAQQQLKLQDRQAEFEHKRRMEEIDTSKAMSRAQFGVMTKEASMQSKEADHEQKLRHAAESHQLELEAMIRKYAAEEVAKQMKTLNEAKKNETTNK